MKSGITMLIHYKDDIEYVTEFPCFLGHPVPKIKDSTPQLKTLLLPQLTVPLAVTRSNCLTVTIKHWNVNISNGSES